MADKKQKFENGVTPVGTLVFPRLNEPDFKFKTETGEFSTKLRLTPEQAASLIEKVDEISEQTLAEAKARDTKNRAKWKINNRPYETETDDNGNETGYVVLKFSMPHKVTSKKTGNRFEFTPALFDARGKEFDRSTPIWGGTTAEVAFSYRPYAVSVQTGAGVSLRLEAVMIHNLVSVGQKSASGYGFAGATVENDDDEPDMDEAPGADSDANHEDF